jgi:hypothetical protein
MPDINLTVPFKITQDEALWRIQTSIAELRMRYGNKLENSQESWDEYVGLFSASVFGQSFTGNVAVHASKVIVLGSVPALVALFKETIESAIRNHLDALLK